MRSGVRKFQEEQKQEGERTSLKIQELLAELGWFA